MLKEQEPYPAVFLDRDGTIIEDNGYLKQKSQVLFYPGVFDVLRELQKNFKLFIVSNQSGISKGFITVDDVKMIHQYTKETLLKEGIRIEGFYFCPHAKEDACFCIKPKPYFVFKAAAAYNIDLTRSFFIGDHPQDVEVADFVLGMKGIYLLTGHGRKHRHQVKPGAEIADNLQAALPMMEKFRSKPENRAAFEKLLQASRIIRQGGIVSFPTETVYGLGADAFNEKACTRIFEIKDRPSFDPLIVHISNKDQISLLTDYQNEKMTRLIERFWPGPLTLIVPKKPRVSDLVTAGLPNVGIRMPAHSLALSFLKLCACPVAAPSANPFGYLSPTTAAHVEQQLGGKVDLILDGGACAVGIESTIIQFKGDDIILLRPGGIPIEEIESITGKLIHHEKNTLKVESPGQLKYHYSPRTKIKIMDNPSAYRNQDAKVGYLFFSEKPQDLYTEHYEILSEKGDLAEASHNLFSSLHKLDDLGLDLILAQKVPSRGLGRGIMNRLNKAAGISEEESI